MNQQFSDLETLGQSLKNKEKLVAMLAPSFVVDFEYPDIITQLHSSGFDKVCELTFGAKMVNRTYHEILNKNPKKSFISSVCPVLNNLVKARYPYLVSNLMLVVSPMVATARILKKYYPEHKNVFIGPCIAKKQEAKEFPEVFLAITFRELKQLFEKIGKDSMFPKKKSRKKTFAKFYNDYTKIYPLAGALAETMHVKEILKKGEWISGNGIDEENYHLQHFEKESEKIRFFDFLTCPGGCIGGPGIASTDSIENRHDKVVAYRDKARQERDEKGKRGLVEYAKEVDFSRKFTEQ